MKDYFLTPKQVKLANEYYEISKHFIDKSIPYSWKRCVKYNVWADRENVLKAFIKFMYLYQNGASDDELINYIEQFKDVYKFNYQAFIIMIGCYCPDGVRLRTIMRDRNFEKKSLR